MTETTITILDDEIPVSDDRRDIRELKFLKDNPRVYACTHGEPGFASKTPEEQQVGIYEALKKEPSVKKLLPNIRRHGGLLEPILVRYDTMEVIEGNSRLAAYRILHERDRDDRWAEINCRIVSSLTPEQLAAYLNEIHVKGKTEWSAYEKANFAFVRLQNGRSYKEVAKLFGESDQTIRTRVRVIKAMQENEDSERSNFSYYDVMVRNRPISSAVDRNEHFRKWLLATIREPGPSTHGFTAQEMRKQLPVVLNKPKVLKKLLNRSLTLEEAYSRANISKAQDAIRRARGILESISAGDVRRMNSNDLNAFKQDLKKLGRSYDRVQKMVPSG